MVLDSNDRTRLKEFKHELFNLVESEELKNSILIIAANKQDLPNAMKVDELKESLEIDKIKTIKSVNIIGTCAKTGEGVYECFELILNTLKLNQINEPFKETYNDTKGLISLIKMSKFWSIFAFTNKQINTNEQTV